MKGFKDTTRMQMIHNPSAAGRTVGQVRSFAHGGTVRRFAEGGHAVPDVDSRGPSAPEGHALVQRSDPQATNELDEGGGRSPLRSGYAKGGKSKAKHFHVHKHYHEGGKIRTVSKSYKGKSAEKAAERQVENAKPMMAKGGGAGTERKGHIYNDTSIPSESPDYATGGTIDTMNAGGSTYAVGGMPQRGVMVGAPAQGSALGSVAAPRPMPGRPMPPLGAGASPVMRAAGGRASPKAGRSAAKAAVAAHEARPAPGGHKGLGNLLRGRN